jgi:RNA polymerase sigma-70 factor (ECF subfamily)
VSAALLVVLDTLSPAERVAFVLHDVFAVPFEDVAVVLDRSTAAVRAGAAAEVRGRDEVAATFAGRARAAGSVLVDGVPGAARVAGGQTRIVFRFALDDAGRINAIDLVADAGELGRLSVGS